MEIRNIEELLQPLLGNGRKVINYKEDRLLATGENYGSVMLKVDFIIVDNSGNEEVFNCVAKLVPPRGVLWDIFDTPSTYKKEIAVYNSIAPALNDFGKEFNIECVLPYFADYYCSRITLQPNNNEVDEDAVLLLKNLSVDGYSVENRFVGFDKSTMDMLIKSLATLHATVISYKQTRPLDFQNKIMTYIGKCIISKIDQKARTTQLDYLLNFLSKYPNLKNLSERFTNGYHRGLDTYSRNRTTNELFGTAVHSDLWTNNILIKYINGSPLSCKFIDFQVLEYANAARDIIFLIYSSAQVELLPHVDDMIKHYYKHFIDTLKLFQIDTNPFTYAEYLKQIDEAAFEIEFGHLMFILPPIFTMKGKATELADMEDAADIVSSPDRIHNNFHSRFAFIVEDFAKRGWI